MDCVQGVDCCCTNRVVATDGYHHAVWMFGDRLDYLVVDQLQHGIQEGQVFDEVGLLCRVYFAPKRTVFSCDVACIDDLDSILFFEP